MKYMPSLPQLKIFSSINFGCCLRRRQACAHVLFFGAGPIPGQRPGPAREDRAGLFFGERPAGGGAAGMVCLMGSGEGVTSMSPRAAQYVELVYSFSRLLLR